VPKWNHIEHNTPNGYSTNKHNCLLHLAIVVTHNFQQDTLFVEMTKKEDKDKTLFRFLCLEIPKNEFSQTNSTLKASIQMGTLFPQQSHPHHIRQHICLNKRTWLASRIVCVTLKTCHHILESTLIFYCYICIPSVETCAQWKLHASKMKNKSTMNSSSTLDL
jgi:hypothetical protein